MKTGREHMCCECRKAWGLLFVCLISMGLSRAAGGGRGSSRRQFLDMMFQPRVMLDYFYGPLLSGPDPIPVYIIWYGNFSNSQRAIVQDLFASFNASTFSSPSPPAVDEVHRVMYPTVEAWWSMTAGYVDANGDAVKRLVYLAGEMDDPYLQGKSITEDDVEQLVLKSISRRIFPAHYSAAYFVLTSADVEMESFCMDACGSHFSTYPSKVTSGQQLPYAWVGNPAAQCPGMCAWPYAPGLFGSRLGPALSPPNGDVGMDGLIINLASMLVGMATNPYNTGYYQGDALSPLEASTACSGIYGPNAYPGDPGLLFVNPATNVSFNAVGVTGRAYLLPAIWLPTNQSCAPPPYNG